MVEGIKTIKEFLNSSYDLEYLYTTTLFNDVPESVQTLVSEADLKKVSFLKNTNSALAVFKMQGNTLIDESKLIVALDNVRDPGNLGTIIRLCDWFGISDLICNSETVDCYNPKVVQATMGSLTRVNITYTNLENYLSDKKNLSVYGTFMDGNNLYSTNSVVENGILVLGNEANGISKEIEKLVTEKITIPKFGAIQKTESLNVAMATSIVLSEFKRKTIVQ